MKNHAFRRMLCAALAAMLLCPAALAENGNLSGYNPFTGEYIPPANPNEPEATVNPFGGSDLPAADGFGAGGALTADDLFGGNTSYTVDAGSDLAAAVNDPFGTGTASAISNDFFGTGTTGATGATGAATSVTNDPFGTITDPAITNDPFGTITAPTVSNDPFGIGTEADGGAIDAGTTGDPFGAVVDIGSDIVSAGTTTGNPFGVEPMPMATATPAPQHSIGGYNPFAGSGDTPLTAMNAVMFVTASSVKLKSKAAEKSGNMGTVYFGQQLAVTGTQGEWAQVQHPTNRRTAYCLMSSLSSDNPNTMNKQMYAQLATVPVYKSPSQRTGRLRNLKRGDTVTMTAITTDGLWARVTADGTNYGFTPSIYLDDAPTAQGTPVWCMSASTPVMVNPEKWVQISTLCFGQPAFLVGYVSDNTIAKIRSSKGYVAYCDASALTTADPANQSTTVYAQATGRVLTKTIGDATQYMNVNKNSQMMLLGVDGTGTWALVRRGKQKLYIPTLFVGTTRQGNQNRVVAATQDVPLYSATNTNATVLGTLPIGTQVYLIGGDSNYARVSIIADASSRPVTGYVPLEYLRGE